MLLIAHIIMLTFNITELISYIYYCSIGRSNLRATLILKRGNTARQRANTEYFPTNMGIFVPCKHLHPRRLLWRLSPSAIVHVVLFNNLVAVNIHAFNLDWRILVLNFKNT